MSSKDRTERQIGSNIPNPTLVQRDGCESYQYDRASFLVSWNAFSECVLRFCLHSRGFVARSQIFMKIRGETFLAKIFRLIPALRQYRYNTPNIANVNIWMVASPSFWKFILNFLNNWLRCELLWCLFALAPIQARFMENKCFTKYLENSKQSQ